MQHNLPLSFLFKRFLKKALAKIITIPAVSQAIYRLFGVKGLAGLYVLLIEKDPYSTSENIVLCLDRLHFSRDVDLLRHNCPEYAWFKAPEDHLGALQKPFIPVQYQNQTQFAEAKQDLPHDPYDISAEMADAILVQLKKRYHITAVMSANVDYWQAEGMRRMTKTYNIPFVVLCREVQTIPMTYERALKHYGQYPFKYNGRAVAVHNQRTAEFIKDVGFCNDNQAVVVTGPPRLDRWLDIVNSPNAEMSRKAEYVTLLSFFTGYLDQNLFFETVEILAEISQKDAYKGQYKFKVKCKGKTDRQEILAALAQKNIDVSNIEFTYEADLLPVFLKSKIIIGYNSLAMIEAVLSPAQSIIPFWGANVEKLENNNIVPNEQSNKVIKFAMTPDMMREEMDRTLSGDVQMTELKDKVAFVQNYFAFDPSEPASARVLNLINSVKSR